jgi:hypothetical protein
LADSLIARLTGEYGLYGEALIMPKVLLKDENNVKLRWLYCGGIIYIKITESN